MIRVISGDNELSALEFQRHYKLKFPVILDPVRSMEKQYNKNGWPFMLLADPKGSIVYQGNGMLDRDIDKIEKLVDEMLSESNIPENITRDGVDYPASVMGRSGETEKSHRLDSFTSLAAGSDGKLYLGFAE